MTSSYSMRPSTASNAGRPQCCNPIRLPRPFPPSSFFFTHTHRLETTTHNGSHCSRPPAPRLHGLAGRGHGDASCVCLSLLAHLKHWLVLQVLLHCPHVLSFSLLHPSQFATHHHRYPNRFQHSSCQGHPRALAPAPTPHPVSNPIHLQLAYRHPHRVQAPRPLHHQPRLPRVDSCGHQGDCHAVWRP